MRTLEEEGHERSVGRRSYLELAAATAVGTIAIRPATASSRATDGAPDEATTTADYETITVPADHHEVVELDDGETLEEVLFDVTATGSAATILATGTDWTIRNVGIRGRIDVDDVALVGAADTDGGTSRIENVWLGDGAAYGDRGVTGIWVAPEHDGHLEVEGVVVREMSDNAFYCSAPGDEGGGTVALRNCYAANCWVAHYRLSEGIVENCVASVTDEREYRQGRGVWAWSPGPVEVRDCHMDMNGHHYSFLSGANGDPSHIDVVETEWDDGFNGGYRKRDGGTIDFVRGNGNDPENVFPEGCPSSIADVLPGEVGIVTLEDQASTGDELEVAHASYTAAETVVVLEDEAGDVRGYSDPIEADEVAEDLVVELEEPLEEDLVVTGRLHHAHGGEGGGEVEGDYGNPVEVGGDVVRDSAEITIVRTVDYYHNEDGDVDTEGLREAISDWRDDVIDTELLREVIGAWRS